MTFTEHIQNQDEMVSEATIIDEIEQRNTWVPLFDDYINKTFVNYSANLLYTNEEKEIRNSCKSLRRRY